MVAREALKSADERSGTCPAEERHGVALRELRAALADAQRRIDQLMVIRRRQLAAARLRRGGQ
jgi:hypothetical protein